MNTFLAIFLLMNVIVLLLIQRGFAPLPLLIGACYIIPGPLIDVGPFSFSALRILIGTGLVRVLIRGERLEGRMNVLDKLMFVWACWALASSCFHKDPSDAIVNRLGLVYDTCGIYFLLRIFCRSLDDVKKMVWYTTIVLIPVAIEMIYENLSFPNLFSRLEGGLGHPLIRGGDVRARGPFAHAILAGTVGAVCLPLMVGLWQKNRKIAFAGIMACVAIILTSSSSGPIMSCLAAIGALFAWRYRNRVRMRTVGWFAVIGYIALDIVMKAPAYYLIARMDLISGSTGWHRARLIESAIEHLSEWWLIGTDYTRHWMPTGVSWSGEHTDITNHYIQLGVFGGLPLMLLFIAILVKGFSLVGQTLSQGADLPHGTRFMIWTLGASLFSHTVTLTSVSYFDQSFLFMYLTLAAIGSSAPGKL